MQNYKPKQIFKKIINKKYKRYISITPPSGLSVTPHKNFIYKTIKVNKKFIRCIFSKPIHNL